MDAKRLEYFRELLVRKRESLTHMVQRTEGYGREKEPDTQDMADMAVESYTKEFMFGKSSGDRIILKQIDDRISILRKPALSRHVNRFFEKAGNAAVVLYFRYLS